MNIDFFGNNSLDKLLALIKSMKDSLTTAIGNKSKVTFTRNQTSGTKVGTINIDGTNYDIYAPSPTTQVQADWNVTDTTSKAYIKNKPTIPDFDTVIKYGDGDEEHPEYYTISEEDSPCGDDGVALYIPWGESSTNYGHAFFANDSGNEFYHRGRDGEGGWENWCRIYDSSYHPNSDRTKKIETYVKGSTTETYGTSYPLYAQWISDSHVKFKCDGYYTDVDYANSAGSAASATNATKATSVVDYGNTANSISIGYAGTGLTASTATHIAAYTDSGKKIKDMSFAELGKKLVVPSMKLLGTSARITTNSTYTISLNDAVTNYQFLLIDCYYQLSSSYCPRHAYSLWLPVGTLKLATAYNDDYTQILGVESEHWSNTRVCIGQNTAWAKAYATPYISTIAIYGLKIGLS